MKALQPNPMFICKKHSQRLHPTFCYKFCKFVQLRKTVCRLSKVTGLLCSKCLCALVFRHPLFTLNGVVTVPLLDSMKSKRNSAIESISCGGRESLEEDSSPIILFGMGRSSIEEVHQPCTMHQGYRREVKKEIFNFAFLDNIANLSQHISKKHTFREAVTRDSVKFQAILATFKRSQLKLVHVYYTHSLWDRR